MVQNTGKASLRPELGHVDECEGMCVSGVCGGVVCVGVQLKGENFLGARDGVRDRDFSLI